MNIKGQTVIHKSFGEGEVLDHAGTYITIQFKQKEAAFVFPDSFESFLTAKDPSINAQIQEKLTEAKQQKIEAKKEKQRIEEIIKTRTAEKQAPKKVTKKPPPRANIAFKCNFCDGGKAHNNIGFNGLCSREMINYNIKKAKHIWCSQPDSPCRQYYDGTIESYSQLEDDFTNKYNGFVCYESAMLRDWRAAAGVIHSGEHKGRPKRILKAQVNSLAVLTTRLPHSKDWDRFIFAAFLIDETHEGGPKDEGYVSTNSKYKIQMTLNEAQRLKFWNYYRCPNSPDVTVFGSGLHRYLTDTQAAQMLRDIAALKKNTPQEDFSQEFYEYFCKVNGIDIESIPPNSGALIPSSSGL